MKNTNKHTPGPWEWDQSGTLKNKDGLEILSTHRIIPSRPNKLDAHLIAASPELLEVVKSALMIFEVFGGHESTGLVDMLEEAIAKAEGK